MHKIFMFIFLVLALILFGCDQTFIIHKSKDIPGAWKGTITEYIVYKDKNQSDGKGTVDKDNNIVDIEHADKRMINFKFTADYPVGEITPDEVLVNGSVYDPKNLYSMDSNTYSINSKGYYPQEGTIDAGKDDVTIKKMLISKARTIVFDIKNKKTSEKIASPSVTFGNNAIYEGNSVKPGQKILTVKASGYYDIKKNYFSIPVGEGPYTLSMVMDPVVETTKTVLKLEITGDYPKGEEIAPQIVLIDGKDARTQEYITPGNHKVEIKDRSYESVVKTFNVPDGIKHYVLKEELVSLPRKIKVHITYDVYPDTEQSLKLGGYKLNLLKDSTGQYLPIKEGDKVKPGTYELVLVRKAYQTIREKIRIWPSFESYNINKKMQAKNREIRTDITFDIEPPAGLDTHIVDFIDIDTGTRRTVKPNGTIKPGKYRYEVNKAGYKMQGDVKKITIQPDTESFLITEKLIAKPRKISFDATYNGVLINTEEVLIDGKVYNYSNKYLPKRYHIVVKFVNFRPIEKDIVVRPGIGPYVVKLNLQPK